MTRSRAFAALALLLAPAAALAQASASPFTAAQRFDAMGRVTGTISPDPDGAGALPFRAVRSSYDGAGRLVKVETGTLSAWQSDSVAPASWSGFSIVRTIETQYDAMGRKTRDRAREGAAGTILTVTQYSYDIMGRLTCTAIRMNPAEFGSLPSSACTPDTEGSHGPGRIVRSVYDAAGQRLQLREGVGSAIEAAEATWAYNANSQVTTVIDGNGNRADLRYDGHGRQDRWTFPSTTRPSAYNDATQASALASAGSVNGSDYEEYGYDAAGNRTSLRKRDGAVLAYGYDALNRMILKNRPGSEPDVTYTYDLAGRTLSASQTGHSLTFTYDALGRRLTETGPLGTMASLWDAGGRRTRLTGPAGYWVGYSHLDTGEMTALLMSNNAPLATFHYDGLGRRDFHYLLNGVSATFARDPLDRLTQFAGNLAGTADDLTLDFTRNPASGIATNTRSNDSYAWTGHYAIARAYTANGLNQYSAAGSASFSYDANGNLTSDGSRTYTYDSENRLVAATGGSSVTLSYDPLGRLYQIATAGGATRRFAYDGDALIDEFDGAGNLKKVYLHGPGVDEPLLWWDIAAGTWGTLQADERGSIIAVANSGGATATINRYDEYGIPAAGNAGAFQYTGQVWLPELGMYFYKARVYSPTLGRFMQVDPVGYEDQYNLYAYVGNDPANMTDPDGKKSCPDNAGPKDCPDIPIPPREIRMQLREDLLRARANGTTETGGQAIQNNRTGEITNRTGPAAGRGTNDSFTHNRAPAGSHTVLRSHQHLRDPGENQRSAGYSVARRINNAPSELDQQTMHRGNRPVQTIGPDVTTTMGRINRQDVLVVDHGAPSRLPSLRGQQIEIIQNQDPE